MKRSSKRRHQGRRKLLIEVTEASQRRDSAAVVKALGAFAEATRPNDGRYVQAAGACGSSLHVRQGRQQLEEADAQRCQSGVRSSREGTHP